MNSWLLVVPASSAGLGRERFTFFAFGPDWDARLTNCRADELKDSLKLGKLHKPDARKVLAHFRLKTSTLLFVQVERLEKEADQRENRDLGDGHVAALRRLRATQLRQHVLRCSLKRVHPVKMIIPH